MARPLRGGWPLPKNVQLYIAKRYRCMYAVQMDSEPYVLRTELAAVLDERPGTLSQMFQRGGFSLPDADCRSGSGNWVKFSMADVAVLALIRALTNLGMQVRAASEAAQYVVEKGGAELSDLDAFVERWRNARLVVSRPDRGWSFMIFETSDDLAGPAAYVTVNVARVVDDAVQRAHELAARRERRRA